MKIPYAKIFFCVFLASMSTAKAATCPTCTLGTPVADDWYTGWNPGSLVFPLHNDTDCTAGVSLNRVMRSWHLKEKNLRDFRRSYIVCYDMNQDGTIKSPSVASLNHFTYAGNEPDLFTTVPTNRLPVGVALRTSNVLGAIKVLDVAMLYQSPANIGNGVSGYTKAAYALNTHNNYSERVLVCDEDKVLTGVEVGFDPQGDSAEIGDMTIYCGLLED